MSESNHNKAIQSTNQNLTQKGTSALIRRGLDYVAIAKSRTIKFPLKKSIGTACLNRIPLHDYENIIIEAERGGWSLQEFVWESEVATAQGDYSVPLDKEVMLSVSSPEDFDNEEDFDQDLIDNVLSIFQPNDFAALSFPYLTQAASKYLSKLTGLKWLELSVNQLRKGDWSLLQELKQLEVFEFSHGNVDVDLLANLKNLNNLQIIRLIHSSIAGRGFEELKKQNNIKSIHWSSCNTDDGVNRLYNLHSLVDLHLSSGLRDQRQINDSDLEGIEQLSSLKILRLRSKKSIGDAGVTRISNLSNLISLEIFDSVITDHSLEKIGQLKLLENLYIDSDLITGQGLSFIQNLDKLEALSIRASTKSFRAGNLVNLTSLSNLASLSLAFMVLDDNAMEKIGNINKLYRLQLSGVHVSSNGLRHLRNLPRLRYLDMMGIRQLEDVGFEHIGSLSSLQSLKLFANVFMQGSVTITNKGLSHISKLTNLQSLTMHGMKISENSIEHIAKMSSLRNLYISKSGIGENAVSELRKALPNCRINDNWN